MALVVLVGYELLLRANGYRPTVADDAQLWSLVRASVRPDDPEEVVLIGASRIRLDINTDVWAHEWGRRPKVLAVNGSDCLPVLADLAEDERFRGVVIVDYIDRYFCRGVHLDQGLQAEYLRAHRQRTALSAFEARLRIPVQSHLTMRLPEAALQRAVIPLLRNGRLPGQWYMVTLPDRSRSVDFRTADTEKMSRDWVRRIKTMGRGVSPDQWVSDMESIEALIVKIEQRGGRVVLVVFPAAGSVRDVEEVLYPRSVYWEPLVRHTQAVTIHCADDPGLSGFDCPDGSHLDGPAAVQFTRGLARIVRAKLAPATPP